MFPRRVALAAEHPGQFGQRSVSQDDAMARSNLAGMPRLGSNWNPISSKPDLIVGFKKSQFAPTAPQLRWFENSSGRDDAGDQFGGRHVKSRIARAAGRIGDAHINARWRFEI